MISQKILTFTKKLFVACETVGGRAGGGVLRIQYLCVKTVEEPTMAQNKLSSVT